MCPKIWCDKKSWKILGTKHGLRLRAVVWDSTPNPRLAVSNRFRFVSCISTQRNKIQARHDMAHQVVSILVLLIVFFVPYLYTPLVPCLGAQVADARRLYMNAAQTSITWFSLAQFKHPRFALRAFGKRAADARCSAGLFPLLVFTHRHRSPK